MMSSVPAPFVVEIAGTSYVYLCEHDAQRALEDCLRDEPHWEGLLRIETIELSADKTSLN
jgi:hypothetical protein